MGFTDDIMKFQQKALTNTNISISKIAEDLFVDAVLLTPTSPEASYATGLLINSWYPSIAGYDETVGSVTDYYGSASLSRIKDILGQKPFFGKDNFVTLTNTVDHAFRADRIGWPLGDVSTGWHWTGKVQAYHFISTAVTNAKGKYT